MTSTIKPLNGKHIVLGITGGIAAYKSATLARLFVKAGAEVQVIMTPNATQFITPLTLSTLTGKPVITEFFTANSGMWNSHVDLGLWADAFVVAPATASSIAKMANGVADNMLITSYLSTRAKVFVAPAMDMDMMKHPSTLRNIQTLIECGNTIIEPTAGELASHLIGKGRMEEPENIFTIVSSHLQREKDLSGKRVLITAGPTYEKIDPVRYIGNYSSGRMGFAIANEAAARGADVTLIAGPVAELQLDPNITRIDVESAQQMLQCAQNVFPDTDIAILTAAVADYRPATQSPVKIKRENNDRLNIEIVKNPDIAATLGAQKRPCQKLIGFALETDHEYENACDKLKRKNLDMIVLNSLAKPGAGFGCETNIISIVKPDGSISEYPLKSKKEVATDVINAILNL